MSTPFDLAMAIELLVPAAIYSGSTNPNTEAAYNALVWNDSRTKPTWAALQAAWITSQVVTKEQRLAQLNADFTAAMTALQGTWPTMEIQTWTLQAEEAKQWTAADTSDKPLTPFLTSLYDKRVALGWSEPFADFVARVLANSVTYTTASANYLGIRHVAEKAINESTDPSTVTWSF